MAKRKVAPWKHNLETDRGYRRRFEYAMEHGGNFTYPGSKPNPMDPEKVARKRKARAAFR